MIALKGNCELRGVERKRTERYVVSEGLGEGVVADALRCACWRMEGLQVRNACRLVLDRDMLCDASFDLGEKQLSEDNNEKKMLKLLFEALAVDVVHSEPRLLSANEEAGAFLRFT